MEHVVNVVGGSVVAGEVRKSARPAVHSSPPARQREAVSSWRTTRSGLRAICWIRGSSTHRAGWGASTNRFAQSRVLLGLLDSDRLDRLADYEALGWTRSAVYPLGEMLADVRRAVWTELSDSACRSIRSVDRCSARGSHRPTRRSIRRLRVIITPPTSRAQRARSSGEPNTDVRALMRGELLALRSSIGSAIGRAPIGRRAPSPRRARGDSPHSRPRTLTLYCLSAGSRSRSASSSSFESAPVNVIT